MLVTGNPTTGNRFLWDGKNGDDADIWGARVGTTASTATHAGSWRRSRGRAGPARWSGRRPIPASAAALATAPPSPLNPRLFLLWNALEGIQGTLYAQGLTSYTPGNPLDAVAANGESVLVYPGADGPVASARLSRSETASRTGTCSTSSAGSGARPHANDPGERRPV
jgi:hypothetical protein